MNNYKKYCLDTNVLIEAWNKYYSPSLCPNYWELLNDLGKKKVIFIASEVNKEILKKQDDLAIWLKKSNIPIDEVTGKVTNCLSEIFKKDPRNQTLVDNTKGRSLADPWVIAHAMSNDAIVVTKEEKITAVNSQKIKIPNVCETVGITYINDFQMLQDLRVKFNCEIDKISV